jgi:hypothetical protein
MAAEDVGSADDRLPRWQRWLIGCGACLLLVLLVGWYWYQDRSDLEAVLAEARALGIQIPRAELTVTAQRQQRVHDLRALLKAAAAYGDEFYFIHSLDQARSGNRPEQDRIDLARAHWSALDPMAVAAVEAAVDAVGPGALLQDWPQTGFSALATDLVEESERWVEQRLALGDPASFVATCRHGDLIHSWDPDHVRFRWHRSCLRATALRWEELAGHREALARVFDDWQADAREQYLARDRQQLQNLLEAADSGGLLVDHLGMRLPAITEHCIGLIERSQRAAVLREHLAWWQDAQALPTFRLICDENRRRFARYARFSGIGDVFSLRSLTEHGSFLYVAWQLRTQRHLALMAAALRDLPPPLDPFTGSPYRRVIEDGFHAFEGAADPGYSPRPSQRSFRIRPAPPAPSP